MRAHYFNYANRPIKQKISLIVLLTSGILFSAMVLAVTLEKSTSYSTRLKNDSIVLAKIIGANSTAALTFSDRETASEILNALQAEERIMEAVLYTNDKQFFTSYRAPILSEGTTKNTLPDVLDKNLLEQEFSIGSGWFDTIQPIRMHGNTIGHIVLRTDLTSFNRQLTAFLFLITGFSILLLILGMIICSRLNREILEPVSQLASTIQDVTRTQNYNLQVPQKYNDEIGVLIDGFNTMMHRIEQRDAELARYRDHLEEQVNIRTSELKITNAKLIHEIEERKATEKKLVHAQKMEAIGTLAGGVAHDLNNILSGVVSYPDLLLMQLPEDSPMKGPIQTIRSSGKKAAAIVQDLLTLARRGVKVEEQIELQKLVSTYLESPECKELLRNHPGVTVRFEKQTCRFGMAGSPVHLSKTLMNLISNGVEAITGTGTVDIVLEHRLLETRPAGFRQWRPGFYNCLIVSDTGMGIEEQYLERIFEPFYSRKVMGRSGTGLGMAVVWGAVEDHKGYITIDSTVGKGTTFTLYFPASDPAPQRLEITASGTDKTNFNGKGQKILVVDDSSEQRQIATAILTHLGYSATSVQSGEEAVDYLKANDVDLVILDMLMDPGINGLETFKRILQFRPEQKAIIASGFSNKQPIEEAQSLGIADYIEKPYSVNRIGKTIQRILYDKAA